MSDPKEAPARGQTQLERWVMHIAQVVSATAIVGGAIMLTDLRTSNAVIRNDIQQINERIADFRAFMSDRYTASQADRELTPIRRDIADHESRLRALEANQIRP